MFTGIVQQLGKITQATPQSGGGLELQVQTHWNDLELGESIAVNGVCLTVTNPLGTFFLSPETLMRTHLKRIGVGQRVNLERAVSLSTRLSGHLVQGHVDGIGRIKEIISEAGSYRVVFEIPSNLSRYCVEKGSIALNGVSLTINAIQDAAAFQNIFVTLIPHTWEHTQFCDSLVGDEVNVEVDVMAKYIEKLARAYLPSGAPL